MITSYFLSLSGPFPDDEGLGVFIMQIEGYVQNEISNGFDLPGFTSIPHHFGRLIAESQNSTGSSSGSSFRFMISIP